MQRKASLNVIFFTVFIDLMGFGILIPILPTFASKMLNISDFSIGIVVAAYSLMQFLFNPVLGRISDKIGRRPVILTSLLIISVSYIIFSIADSLVLLLLSRVLAGLGGSNIGVAQAYIADITTKSDRSKGMGIIGAAFGLGFVFGPLIGGYLSSFSYSIAGYGSAAFSFLAFIFAFFALPESLKEKDKKGKLDLRIFDLKYTKEVLSKPSIGFLVLLFFIIVFSMANIYGTFSILGYKNYHFTDQEIGLLFAVIGITSAIIQGGLIRRLSKKFRDKSLVLFGTILMMIGLGLIPYGINFTGVALVVIVLSLGTGILQPTVMSMISKFAPENEQGAILGINQSMASLARVLGPIWGGFAFEFIGYQFPFLTGAAFTLLTFIIALKYLQNEKKVEIVENVKDGKLTIDKALLLAPMEDVTSIPFRKLCKELGADIVYTEFVNSDGLIRKNKKTHKKLEITEEERPVGIQIYGGNLEPMVESAKIAEEENPDVIDINAGCWVKKVAKRGAGAGLLKDPEYLQKMVGEIVKVCDKPVTVKTRIGWDDDSILILDIAKRLEDVGIKALTVHCRTRSQGHSGEPAWEWIPKIKEVVKIPVIVNGGIFSADDAKRAFNETGADGIMIARGAIEHPWIFKQTKELLQTGSYSKVISNEERIETALRHLRYEIEYKEMRSAVIPFRKFYSGYLKGLYGSSKIRQELMKYEEYDPIEEILRNYLEYLNNFDSIEN